MRMVSVVVLNWNGKHHLDICLQSLLKQRYHNFEIIMVDNGSNDDSVEHVKHVFPQVRILPLCKNVGFAAGNNAGILVARGDLIALLNNDTEVHPDWIAALVQALEDHPEVGFCASTMLDFEHRTVIDSAGLGFSSYGIAYRKANGLVFDLAKMQSGPTFAACGGAMLIRKSILDTIGLLDEDFFMYSEDVDLCFRSQLIGRIGWYVPDAIVYHKQSASSRTKNAVDYWFRLRVRNNWWVLIKNMPTPLIVRYMPRIMYGIIRTMGGCFFNQTMPAYLDGTWNAWKKCGYMFRKRKKIQTHSHVAWQQIDNQIDAHYPYGTLFEAIRKRYTRMES